MVVLIINHFVSCHGLSNKPLVSFCEKKNNTLYVNYTEIKIKSLIKKEKNYITILIKETVPLTLVFSGN